MDIIEACKLAYRKHWLNDESIRWNELGDCLQAALCNHMGDEAFQKWLDSIREDQDPPPDDEYVKGLLDDGIHT